MAHHGGRPQSEGLDRAIRLAAWELLAEVGFTALSLAEIARRAGTTPPAIYRRFANKAEIVVAAIEHDLSQLEREPADAGNLRADLIDWTEGIMRVITPERNRILFSLVLAGSAARAVRDKLAATFDRRVHGEWTAIADRAVTRGELVKRRVPRYLPRLPVALVSQLSVMDQPIDRALARELVDTIILPALRGAGAVVVPTRGKRRERRPSGKNRGGA